MSEKRFIGSYAGFYDKYKDNRLLWSEWEEITRILNNLNEKSVERSKALSKLQKENNQLKSTIKEVYGILCIDVDVFSDKATEHDINAYIELRELDNKDAYYMAKGTKKAIELLKRGL